MNKVIIDIGTHQAQELRVLSGDRYYIIRVYLAWWFDWFKRNVKRLIPNCNKSVYGVGAYQVSPVSFGLNNHLGCLKQIFLPKSYLLNNTVISIDPIASITLRYLDKIKSLGNVIYLPMAILFHDDEQKCKLAKFYTSHDGLSSSLSRDNNFDETYCPSFSFETVLQELKSYSIIRDTDEIVIRMNCEGAEMGIIQSSVKAGLKIKTVMGSVNDVKKKFGKDVSDEMMKVLESKKVFFTYFKGSDPSTWPDGFSIFR